MKKLLLFSIALLSLNLFVNAQKVESKEQILAETNNLGIIHNQTLENFYNEVVLQKNVILARKGGDPKGPIIDIINSTILVNVPANPMQPFFSKSNTGMKLILESELEKAKTNLTKSNSEIINSLNISKDVKSYVMQLQNLVSLYSNEVSKLEIEIGNFNDKVYLQYSNNPNTIKILFAASSIAKYSAQYWQDNSTKWKEINLYPSNTSGRSEACCKSIVNADVGGAVGGAVAGLMAGGVGALPGAAAGCVGGSVGQGVIELLNWLW